MRFRYSLLVPPLLLLTASGCSDALADEAPPPLVGEIPDAIEIPSVEKAPLTTERTIRPLHEVVAPTRNPQVPELMDAMLEEGMGDWEFAEGVPIATWTMDDATPPPAGASAKMLTRFVFLADTQLADDESPARLATWDNPVIAGAYRPHEGHECRILNAAVRTINAFHRETPVDFVLLGGDNIDNAQSNELDWFTSIMNGSPHVHCKSGDMIGPVPQPADYPKNPFVAEGLDMPWRWVTGNHDILKQGNYPPKAGEAEGTEARGGTRDWSLPGGPVVEGEVVPDPNRAMLSRAELLERISNLSDGHGITDDVKAYGKTFYWFDVEDTAVRIVVMDTAAETGAADGIIQQVDVDGFLEPALDQAKADGKWVILTSHHGSSSLRDGGGPGGRRQKDALSLEDWYDFVGRYDNVIMHLAGHTHIHRVNKRAPEGGSPYWEVESSALADWPHQMRVVEIWDQDNDYVMIRAIGLDYIEDDDPVVQDGRRRGIADYTCGYQVDGAGDPTHRNVELWIPKPGAEPANTENDDDDDIGIE